VGSPNVETGSEFLIHHSWKSLRHDVHELL
jgi:hypothetical protein